jgi:hypothetical protein
VEEDKKKKRGQKKIRGHSKKITGHSGNDIGMSSTVGLFSRGGFETSWTNSGWA